MALSDVRAAIHGVNALLDRPLLLLLPGEEVSKADNPAKVEAGVVVMDRLHLHHQDLDILAEAKGLLDLLAARVVGLLPGNSLVERFYGTVADSHGGEYNQCGSSFYGPAYGGGVYKQGVGAGVSQPNVAPGYPASIGHASNPGAGPCHGYSVNGAGRPGDGGLLPEAIRGDDGRDKCTKCGVRVPITGPPLVPCVGCGMRACDVCCPFPARLCESCRSSPGRSSQRDRASPGRGSQRDKRTPSPKLPRRQSPAGPADRACWEYTKTGKCQYGRECKFKRDKSSRNPAAPSTPRTGDRPVGTKPITPRTTAGPVVLPIGRRGVSTAPLKRIDGFLGGVGRNPEANRVVVACPVMWAVAPATGGSAPGCLPPCVSSWEKSERNALFFSVPLMVEAQNGTKSSGEGPLTQTGS